MEIICIQIIIESIPSRALKTPLTFVCHAVLQVFHVYSLESAKCMTYMACICHSAEYRLEKQMCKAWEKSGCAEFYHEQKVICIMLRLNSAGRVTINCVKSSMILQSLNTDQKNLEIIFHG